MRTIDQEKERLRLHYQANKELIKARSRAYRLANLDSIKKKESERRKANKEKYYAYFLMYKYQLTKDRYDELLLSQNGICANPFCTNNGSEDKRRKRLFVDHCHRTNKVRGLLCCTCNRVLGLMKDSSALLRGLADYVDKHNAS